MAEPPKLPEKRLRSRSHEISTAASPKRKKRKASESALEDVKPVACIQSLPPEMLEQILSWMSISDIISFGATCSAFHRLSLTPAVWREIYHRSYTASIRCMGQNPDWRRAVIMKHTQSLLNQRLGPGAQMSEIPNCRSAVRLARRHVTPPGSLGYRRLLLTRDHQLLWDHRGTIYRLTLNWGTAHRYDVLCKDAKDFAVDPRSDISHREYVYVLVSSVNPTSPGGPQPHDCVEVYQEQNGRRVFRMTFHPSLRFTQISLIGCEARRTMLLLTDTGKVYGLSLNETQFTIPHVFTIQLALKNISTYLPQQTIAEIHTSHSSALHLTTEGTVFLEVHSAGVYNHLFGTHRCYDPHRASVALPLSLPYKVVKCSLGQSHLCLLDDCRRMFMQGSNRYGQLGTGDKIDRGQPTPVALSMTPVEVFCGLNHSLALLQGESGAKEIHGCGCGAGGRLPGCPKGSAVFARLSVAVPRSARSICSSKDSLFMLCCHDTAEPRLPCPPPSATPLVQETREETEEREVLWRALSQMTSLRSNGAGWLEVLLDAVKNLMTTLSTAHRDFLVDALALVQDALDNVSPS